MKPLALNLDDDTDWVKEVDSTQPGVSAEIHLTPDLTQPSRSKQLIDPRLKVARGSNPVRAPIVEQPHHGGHTRPA